MSPSDSHCRVDRPSAHGAWLTRFTAGPVAAVRLFLFPYAGAGAASARPWAQRLPADVEAFAVQLPGRESRRHERPFENLTELIPALTRALQPDLREPFVFFGHSMGALLAFEVARHLRERGQPQPSHLFLSARRGPQRPDPLPPLRQLPDAALIGEIRRRWNGIPAAVLAEPELLRLFVPTLRADVSLIETYRYRPQGPLGCGISCFGGVDDGTVTRSDLEDWRHETQGPFSVRMFPGGHFYLREACASVFDWVARDLRRVLGAALDHR